MVGSAALAGSLAGTVKTRVKRIKVFGIQLLLDAPKSFPEALEMHHLAGAEEADGVRNLGNIFDDPENIVVGGAGLLLCRQILKQIRQRIALALELAGVEGNPSRRLGPDADGMINIIGGETAFFDFFIDKSRVSW